MLNEAGTKIVQVLVDGMHCESCINTIRDSLESEDGIEYADVTIGKVNVSFIPQMVNLDYIKSLIVDAGYQIRDDSKRKGFFGRYIDRMIESNQKNFGNQRLDCCSLPKGDSPRKQTH